MGEYYSRFFNGRWLAVPHGERAVRMVDLWRNHLRYIPPHHACHGFRKDRSIHTAVAPHRGKAYVMRLDLRHFFRDCTPFKVSWALTQRAVSVSVINETLEVCFYRGGLPLGACTSPALANLAALGMDRELDALGLTYTRYADDILLSSDSPPDEGQAREVIKLHGFKVNEGKSWLRNCARMPAVAFGLTVSDGNSDKPPLNSAILSY